MKIDNNQDTTWKPSKSWHVFSNKQQEIVTPMTHLLAKYHPPPLDQKQFVLRQEPMANKQETTPHVLSMLLSGQSDNHPRVRYHWVPRMVSPLILKVEPTPSSTTPHDPKGQENKVVRPNTSTKDSNQQLTHLLRRWKYIPIFWEQASKSVQQRGLQTYKTSHQYLKNHNLFGKQQNQSDLRPDQLSISILQTQDFRIR